MELDPALAFSKHHIQSSPVLTLLHVFWVAFLGETAYAVVMLTLVGTTLGQQYAVESITLLLILHTIKFVVEIYFILRIVGRVLTTRYYITDRELVGYKGLFENDEKVYDLKKLQSVELSETWFGRHLNYGTLYLIFASAGYKEEVRLNNISDAHQYRRVLHDGNVVVK